MLCAALLLSSCAAPVSQLPPPPENLAGITDFDALPDAVIVTQSLAQLPKDVLAHPWLKDVLTEDFINYYEDNEGAMGLRGALRRIAYEHQATVMDAVLTQLLNTPAEIAFWKAQDGKLSRFLMTVPSSGLLQAIELLAKIAANDAQLTQVDEIALKDGAAAPVYQLSYVGARTLFVVPAPSLTYIFSDRGIALPENAESAASIGMFSQMFGLKNTQARHAILLNVRYVSFGYQQFFPVLKAFSFSFQDGLWKMGALTAQQGNQQPNAAPLWKIMPHRPALAVAVPVAPLSLENILTSMLPEDAAPAAELLKDVASPAVIGWYPDSKLYAPLFIIHAPKLATQADALRGLFEKSVGKIEEDRPVNKGKGSFFWLTQANSKYGIHLDEQVSKTRFFTVGLAYHQGYVIFSPDHRLVENALAALNKTYPAVADSLPKAQKNAALILEPDGLTRILTAAIEESLPVSQEPLFRDSVTKYLYPRFDILRAFPTAIMTMPVFYAVEQGVWQDVSWQSAK